MFKRRPREADLGSGGVSGKNSRQDRESSREPHRTDEGAPSPDVATELTRLAERNYRAIYNLVYSYMGGDREEAEDLTVQTFEHAFAAYHRFRGEADVKTWVFRIAINLCKNRIRQKQTRRRFEAFSMDDQPFGLAGELAESASPMEISDGSPSPEDVVEHRETMNAIREAVSRLPEDYRTVLLLKLQDLSYKEIADVLDTSVEAVKSRLFRARVMLKQEVEPYLE